MNTFTYFRDTPEPWPWLEDRFGCGAVIGAATARQLPGGVAGYLFRHPDALLPALLDWHRFGDGQYVGWTPGQPPGPDDLDRGLSMSALEIELRDAPPWKFPRVLTETALDADREPGLPDILTVAGVDDSVERPYSVLVGRAESIRDRLTAGVETDIPVLTELIEYVASLLGVHYRIGLAEVLALDLLTHTTIDQMILASIDGLESLRSAVFAQTGQRGRAAIRRAGSRRSVRRHGPATIARQRRELAGRNARRRL